MTFNRFKKDLEERGEPIERRVVELLKKFYDKEAYKVEGYDKEKDIVCPTKNKTLEVKNCNEALYFVPIEFSVNGKPSGIITTKSDYWVILAKDKFHFIKTEVLRKLIEEKEIKKHRIQDQDVELKLLRIEDLEEFSSRVSKC